MARSRLHHYSRRALFALLGVLALVVLAVLVLLGSLDTAYFRGRIRKLVKLPIDWQHTEISLTRGVVLRGFSVASPAPFDKVAPELVTLDRLEVSWSLGELLGKGPLAERIVVSGVHATIVVDEKGKDSVTALTADPNETDEPVEGPELPRSHMLEVLGARLPLEQIAIDDAEIKLIKQDKTGTHGAEVRLDGVIELPAVNQVRLDANVTLRKQDLVDELPPVHELVKLKAGASFEPNASRIVVTLNDLNALDGAVVGALAIELPDGPPPLVQKASLVIDSTPIQATLSHLKSPIRLRGKVKLEAKNVRLAALPSVEKGGMLDVDAKVDSLAVHFDKLHVEGERLGLDVKLGATGSVEQAHVKLAAHRFNYDHGMKLALDGAELTMTVDGLDPYATVPLRMAHGFHLRGPIAKLDLRPGSLEVIGEAMKVDIEATVPGEKPGSLELDMPIERLAVALGGRPILGTIAKDRSMKGDPAHLHSHLSDVRFDPASPLTAQASEKSEIVAGPFTIHSQLDKRSPDGVAFDLDVVGTSLAPIGLLVSLPQGMSVPWGDVATHVHTKGRVTGLHATSAFAVEHQTDLELDRFALRGSRSFSASKIIASTSSHGGIAKHAGTLSVATEQLVIATHPFANPTLKSTFAFDRAHPSVALDVALSGGNAPKIDLHAIVDVERATRGLAYELHLDAARLGMLTFAVPSSFSDRYRIDLGKLRVNIDGKGSLRDVLELRRGIAVAPDALEKARGDATLKGTLRNVDYQDLDGAMAATFGALDLGIELSAADDRDRTIDVTFGTDHGEVDLGEHVVTLDACKGKGDLDVRGSLKAPEVAGRLELSLAKVGQDYYAPYPVGGVTLTTKMRADTRGILRIEQLDLVNKAGGTKLSLKGGLDLATRALFAETKPGADPQATSRLTGRAGIDLDIALEQSIGALALGDGITASGTVKLPIRVQSGDLQLFSVRGAVELQHVDATIARSQLVARGVEGRVPVSLDLIVEPHRAHDGTVSQRVRVVPHPMPVSFAQPHFAAHQPFLATRSFFSVETLKIRTLEMGPIAGNLALDNTRLELSQLEMHASGGRIRGQLFADIAGKDTRIAFRGDVTGLQPPGTHKRDDRLDANMSLVIEPVNLSVEGRADLVHISRALLLDLLDTWDPYHAEVTANRARLALRFGYPDMVRLSFAQGFASLKLQLGGITRAVRIDEMKGVPVGPLLEKYVGDTLRPLLVPDEDEDAEESTP